ncbi:hypothetical protein, partial [Clostridium sp. HCS.1]|uniref:hypothetical protein n=1 Tax=Clostridium sp. HCS.1 TaxID=3238594 RepID=UPI003A102E81
KYNKRILLIAKWIKINIIEQPKDVNNVNKASPLLVASNFCEKGNTFFKTVKLIIINNIKLKN